MASGTARRVRITKALMRVARQAKPVQQEIVVLAQEDPVTTSPKPIDLATPATFATATFALG
jgi:hypothetical protein